MISRVMGLVREQTFAFFFGAGVWTDAFNVAFRIPNLLRDLFAEGAMSSAFVPIFNATFHKQGKDAGFRLTNITLTMLGVIVGVITILGIILSPFIVSILAPGFVATFGKFELTVLMTRIMFPFLLAISWAAIAMGVLNSLNEFFIPAIAPVFLNGAMIIAGFSFCPFIESMGYPSIVGMAMGAMLGGILQMAVQFFSLWKKDFRLKAIWDLKDENLRKIFILILPGTIGLAATQINIAVSTILATSQGDGAVSWLGYAFRIMQLPLGIFGVSIAQATLPVFSRHAAASNREEMANSISDSIKLTGFMAIFASFSILALAEPIIRIVFEHGKFNEADTFATSIALQSYAVGLTFFSLVKLIGPAFYALGDTKTPIFASIASVIANLALNLLLIGPFGYWGLALGSSLAAVVNSGILYYRLRKRLGNLTKHHLLFSLGKICLAALFSAGTMKFMNHFLPGKLACFLNL
ncbi:murein biosynthesis integral membrane protein MurJ, partial [bacterium]|nr:murein biosynthesis integral membrane protein MurJ [bacterium]